MAPDDARQALAELAWLRFRAAVENHFMSERDAFLDTIRQLLSEQDAARTTLQ